MLQIELTETQLSNLFTFLNRVQLSGAEAAEFLNIIQQLRNAKISLGGDDKDKP